MSFWLDVWLNVIQCYSRHWVKPCCRKMIYDDDFNYFLNPYVEGKSKQNSQNNWLTWAWFLLNKFLCSLPEILNFCFFSVTWQIFRRNVVRLEWSWENWLLYVYVFSGQRQVDKVHHVHLKSWHLHEWSQAARDAAVIATASSAQLKSDGFIPGNWKHIAKYSTAGSKIAAFQFKGTVRKGSTVSG